MIDRLFAPLDAHEMTDRAPDDLIDASAEPPIIVSEPPDEEQTEEKADEAEAEAEVSVEL